MKKILVIAAMALLTLSASAQKLGRVNFTELYQLAPEADAAREQINAMQNEAQETFNSMVEEYQTKANQYQQKSASWTAAIKESKEKELVEIQNRIQEFQQTISQELQQQQAQLTMFMSSKSAPCCMSTPSRARILRRLPARPSVSRKAAPSSSSSRSSRLPPRRRPLPPGTKPVFPHQTKNSDPSGPEFFVFWLLPSF